MANALTSQMYGDYNATSPLRPEAREAMHVAMGEIGNPSSIHGFGRAARKRIETARASILNDLGLPDYRLAFTSGASEALATVLTPATQSLATKQRATHLLIAPTDHVAALQGHGFDKAATTYLSVGRDGAIDTQALKKALSALPEDAQTIVSVHGANNETGVLQPIDEIAALCDVHQALFVCDLVQWVGRLPVGDARPAAIIVSAHKLGGPAGIGAIVYDPMRLHLITPLIRGGGQERGLRAGTENAIGIAGFAAALKTACDTMAGEQQRLADLRDRFEHELLATHPDAVIFGRGAARLANTSCFAIPGREAALALMQLDLDGIALSSGSACSSGKVKASHVLAAMDVPPSLAACALRLSLGFATTSADIDQLLTSVARWSTPDRGLESPGSDKISRKNANLTQSAIGESA
ncbi:MAG: cysteine desulfurase [Rhizobiales bacterium]|nr:cysteine desulfurase [Hyphomicrobiales bacterium]MBO6698235.1 cysteine desulfurase [Hyphomicrobiales bacterium]MBO6735511.1 cysteine desulfurase [Hyphomicrobiales bacterium]MBO6910681.1 cysteine desulfurase [Hyphomicrobiales bacterium]MBO6956039.1 cysteine desulfurase [Hyphomicrobiales bacterium]